MAFNPTPCTNCGGGDTGGPGQPAFDSEQTILCDVLPDGTIAGTAMMVTTYDEGGGGPIGPPSPVDPVTGDPYVVQGTLQPCDTPCLKCDTTTLCDNTQVPGETVVTSTIVMLDTEGVAGDDGWSVTGYNTGAGVTPGGSPWAGLDTPPLPLPYPVFYSPDWVAAFNTRPGVTPINPGDPNAGKAFLVQSQAGGVDCGEADDFATSCARYVVEKTFNTGPDCTQIRVNSTNFKADGAARVLIDGQFTGIFGDWNSPSPDGTIVLNVAPGAHTMTIDLRDAGPPTWIKGGLTIECLDITEASTESVQFLRTTCRTCAGDIVSVTDTTLDGQTPYVPGDEVTVCDPGASNVPVPCASCESFVLADRRTNPNGNLVCSTFLRRICHNCDGSVSSTTDTLTDGVTPYSPTGIIGLGCDFDMDEEVLCDYGAPGGLVTFVRTYVKDPNGAVIRVVDVDLDGVPYVVVGPIASCTCASLVLGDVCITSADFPGLALHASPVRDCAGNVTYINPATGIEWPNFIAVVICPPDNELHEQILCDQGNGGQPFRRVYTVTALGSTVDYDEDLAGAPYAFVGPATVCGDTAVSDQRDVELQVLCDATPTRFLRRYLYDEAGLFVGVTNTTLDGNTLFVPVGAVGICTTPVATDFDVAEEILCDANSTPFIRRFTFNSLTGAVVSTVNLTLAGAAFAPVGAVGVCTNCCPIEIGNGCYNAGSGRYTALRLPTGIISLIDSVTGAAVLPAAVIPCADDDVAKTLTAQARLLTNAAPWTLGADVPAGVLTSLTVTGLSGLWDMVDQNGTALVGLPAGLTLTWSAEDDNTLTPPTSVTPQAVGSVVANWTVR